ncbi:SUZ domain-containing protein [Hirschfeldia incana]|nr:SUZ domain-containing protein [Hirschfeldia incana]
MAAAMTEKEAMVDPFLVEALQNPRHRLTILRMELDIQKFFQNPDQLQFEFQPFPTSYLRLAAHRVAQHYGLVTMSLENGNGAVDGSDNRILATKTAESRFPSVCLSDIPVKQPEIGKPEGFKIAIKARPKRGSGSGGSGSGVQQNLLRSVEERKEEYDKARARIFNSPSSSDSEDSSSLLRAPPPLPPVEGVNRNETEVAVSNSSVDAGSRSSRVAIIRDREKDRYDPDYDRSYERYVVDPAYRYVRVMPPGQSFNPMPMHVPFHDGGFPQMARGPQANLNYGHPAMSPFINNHPAAYAPWPNLPSMNYVQSLNRPDFRHPSASNP